MSHSLPDIRKIEPVKMIRRRRKVVGMSAVLLPFCGNGTIDWNGFDSHVIRTLQAGLVPAVNMDTGYANLIDDQTRATALAHTAGLVGRKKYVAGAFVADRPGARWNPNAYRRQIDVILKYGGTPVIFQSYGLISGDEKAIPSRYNELAAICSAFIAFELGAMFAPFGRIYSLETYRRIMQVPQCIGAKHSSLSRKLEWQRIRLRDSVRPDFMVLTGNDLAIDMIMYGSDYLLGLGTFAPDLFALRDRFWAKDDPRFYELNDLLQYLGFFAFRDPVPAYKHTAAQLLKLQGWIATNRTHPRSPTRPGSDIAILQEIMERLNIWRRMT